MTAGGGERDGKGWRSWGEELWRNGGVDGWREGGMEVGEARKETGSEDEELQSRGKRWSQWILVERIWRVRRRFRGVDGGSWD